MRRVLVLNQFAAPRTSAGGTRHVELFGLLKNWEPTIVAGDRNYLTGARQSPDAFLTTVRTLPYTGNPLVRVLSWASYSVMTLIRGLSGPRPTVVYASSPHLLAGLVGLWVARLRRARFVLEIRDMWPQILVDMDVLGKKSIVLRGLEKLERFLYNRADATVALADGLRDQMVERGASAAKTVVLPNGPDPEEFTPPAPKDALRARYCLNGTVIAYTGAHGPANGLDAVLDAAADLRVTEPDVLFLLVGDGAEKTKLVERARREALPNVRFIDPVPKQEMPALLGSVDAGLLVFADRPIFARHMSANKLYDYMAAGLPVITTVPGDGAKYVSETGAGIVVGPHGLVDAVRQFVATSDDELRRMGESGRHFIATHQSRTITAARLEALLDSLAAE